MRKAIIIIAALALPVSASAQGSHPKHAKHAKQKAQAKQAESPGMVFIGPDGNMVDMKKDKCWGPTTNPYRAPGWC